jgi:hypothetical protein
MAALLRISATVMVLFISPGRRGRERQAVATAALDGFPESRHCPHRAAPFLTRSS